MTALEPPGAGALLTQWAVQPVALVVAAALVLAYARNLRRLAGPWPMRRTIVFAIGVAALVWASCGFLQVYSRSLYWVWTTQTLAIWLAVPILVLAGHPVQLARAAAKQQAHAGMLERFLASRFARVTASPLIGPALVPVLSAVLFFGPLPAYAIRAAPIGWALQFALMVIGSLMVLPLVGLDREASSLAVGLSLAIGSFELVLDALPGVVLRLHAGLATSWFDHRVPQAWSPRPLHDQQTAGAILWCLAEVIDLPFLALVFRRWLRADARDAAQVDAVLEAERVSRRAIEPAQPTQPQPLVDRDEPWWLSDPAMRERLRRGPD